MSILNETEKQTSEQSVFIREKNKTVSYPGNMDEFDINHNLSINEYGDDPYKSTANYFISAAEKPESVWGKLKNSLLTIVGLHPDKDAIGARAVIALNEVNRVRTSDLSDEEKEKEISMIHEDVDSYLSNKGIYTRSAQNLAMSDFMLNVGMIAIGGGAIAKLGAKTFTKGLLKYVATNQILRRGVFPALKYTGKKEGEDYEYKPLSLSELLNVKTEETGLKVGTDLLEAGITGALTFSPQIIKRAKITSVVKDALPKLEQLFAEKGISIPKEGLNVDYVMQMATQSPELSNAILQAADTVPFYKALGTRASALIPSFKPGDKINISQGLAKVIRTEGENVVLDIAGKEIIQKAADLAKQMKPIKIEKTPISPKEGGEQPIAEAPKQTKGVDFKQRSFISSIQEELPELKVAGQYIPRDTDKLAIQARNLIKDNISAAELMAKKGTDDKTIAVGSELLKYYSQEAAKSDSEAVKDSLYDKAAELGNSMAKRLTELGRSVQAASILSRLTPEGQIRFAAKTIQKYNEAIEKSKGGPFGLKKKIPELTPDQIKDIAEAMNEIETLPPGEEKAIKFKDLQEYISDLVPTPIMDKVVAVWKAGLLTGLKTSGVNILANINHAFGTEVIKDIPASMVDFLASLKTGKRTTTFTVKGIPKGGQEGFGKGWRFLKTGYDERNVLTKYDYKKVSFGKSKVGKGIQTYEEFIFRLMGTEDQPFYYGAKARSLYGQAKAEAINNKLRGVKAKAFIDKLVTNPTDEMLLLAATDAETAVFQNKTALSEAAGQLKKIKGMEFLIPFSKTPSAVAMQVVNYSPAGIAKTIFRNAGKGKFDQRDFSQGMGRGFTGIAVLALGMYLFKKGLIVLDRPVSQREKKLWELEGRKPNSIKIGNKYRSIQVLGPAGNLLIVGAQFAKALKETGSITGALIKGSVGGLKSFTEQTFLTGIRSAMESIMEPEKRGEYFASGLLSSSVPTIMNDIANATDPKMRRAENIPQRFISRVPILRQVLEPQVDVLGRERFRQENFFEVMADPTRPYTELKDPIVDEIRRLDDAGFQVSTTLLGTKEGYKVLSQKQNTQLWQRAGQLAYSKIQGLVTNYQYPYFSDDRKSDEINKIFNKAKLMARVEMMIEITNGLQGEALKKKLSKAKKDGLLTQEVYKQYQRFR